MRYDNRGDPALCNTQECAWLSRFNAYGARLELPQGWTVISQWLDGDTSVGKSLDGRGSHILGYWSDFVLVSKTAGPHRITARYERFHTKTLLGANKFNSNQDGAAFMQQYQSARARGRAAGCPRKLAAAAGPLQLFVVTIQASKRLRFHSTSLPCS